MWMIFSRRSIRKVKVFRKTAGGSITVFASLSLLLVASFLLVLLEAARVKGLEAYVSMQSINAMESVFSEYERELFDRYGIFLLDGGYGSGALQISQINGRLQTVAQQNARPFVPAMEWKSTKNFYQMDVTDASVSGYLLATDHDGAPFRAMAAASVKARFGASMLQTLYNGLSSSEHAMEDANQSRSALDAAQENIRAAREKQAEEAEGSEDTEPQEAVAISVENPMDIVKAFQEADILTLVLPSGCVVSTKEIRGRQMLEDRTLLQGNEDWQTSADWSESVLFQKFLQEQFSCFTSDRSGGGTLDYELEYIHAGKSSDRENLKSVVSQLLLLREGANYLYLQTDAAKQQEAYSVATAIAASFGIAPVAPLIAQGILAAWAYTESILDVRTLLSGGRISWMKTSSGWTSSLSGIGGLLSGNMRAKEQPNGESYQDYLQKLLWLHGKRSLNYRTMDLMEMYGEQCGRTIRMDAMVLTLRADFIYESEALFFKIVNIESLSGDRWELPESALYSYFL